MRTRSPPTLKKCMHWRVCVRNGRWGTLTYQPTNLNNIADRPHGLKRLCVCAVHYLYIRFRFMRRVRPAMHECWLSTVMLCPILSLYNTLRTHIDTIAQHFHTSCV